LPRHGQPARSATSTSRSEFDELRRAHDDHRIDLRRHALDRFLPVGRRVADVFLVRQAQSRGTPLEHRDDVDRVVDRQRRLRHEGERRVRVGGANASASATVSISVIAPSGSCPIVPITSGWPLCR
jgi:hypothetical protein